MKKEWLLPAASVCITLLIALGLIRWLAPHLLGISVPVDLQVVQLSEKVPPFYEGVLSLEELSGQEGLINDPYTGHRHIRMIPENSADQRDINAPFDLLGFRNREVPVVADVVTIGDSQTVGPNAPLDFDWPSLLKASLPDKRPVVYNMSVGGWGGVQYLYMFEKAVAFRPRVVVVAYYTGNDPMDAIHLAYGFEPWRDLATLPKRPKLAPQAWPPQPSETWKVRFADGVETVFTPKTRLYSNNRDYPGPLEGYRILAETARRIDAAAGRLGVKAVFTIIPTKELVYAPKVSQEGVAAPEDYQTLVRDEAANVRELAKVLGGLPHSAYAGVVGPLQQAALQRVPLYPPDGNGHPVAYGYQVIAHVLASAVDGDLPEPPRDGLALVSPGEGEGTGVYFLIRDGVAYRFASEELVAANGWRADAATVRQVAQRDLATIPGRGEIFGAVPERFGPR